MNEMLNATVLAVAALFAAAAGANGIDGANPPRPRLFVLTDIANEPDDEESLVRLLVYANEFDIEGLVATTSCYLRENPRTDLIRRAVDAYGEVHTNLVVHAKGYPAPDALRSVIATGQVRYGLTDVERPTEGSRLLAKAIAKEDARPLWIAVWGGRYEWRTPKGETAELDLGGVAADAKGDIHVILKVRDNGEPNLFAYRRAIVTVK